MTRGPGIAAALLAALFAAAPAPAEAQVDVMRGEMHDYFDGEVAGSWIWFGEGLAAAGASGAILAFYDGENEDFWRGAAIPVAVIGLAQMITGASILLRTPGWVERFDDQLDTDPATYRSEELTRMDRINFQYELVRWVEIGLFAAGAGLLTYGLVADDQRFTGAGIGLMAQILITFLTDLWATARADAYTEALRDFTP